MSAPASRIPPRESAPPRGEAEGAAGDFALSVGQLTDLVKRRLEDDGALRDVWVRGELSNYRPYGSGHHYFSLKDEEAVVACVMFRGRAASLAFGPEDGLAVLARGEVGVYKPRGQYQLVVAEMVPAGEGVLALRFRQLKERLEHEGLFDPAKKRPLPPFPLRVGVVTSKEGAVLRDIVRIATRRFPGVTIVVASTRVQGDGAAEEIAAAIRLMNERRAADVLIVGRGGGSIEDLWAFNEEVVVRAIVGSAIPVVSAVGHETDVTLADFAADVSAPTPSAAAELAVPDVRERGASVAALARHLAAGLRARLADVRGRLAAAMAAAPFRDPFVILRDRAQRVDLASDGLVRGVDARRRDADARLREVVGKLDSLSPLAVLARGYSVTLRAPDRSLVSRVDDVDVGAKVVVLVRDGELAARVEGKRTKE